MLRDKLNSYIAEVGSQNVAAKAIGLSSAVLSGYRSNTYKGNVERIETTLTEFFATKEAAKSLKSKTLGDYCKTTISEAVYNTIRLCHLKGGLAIEAGDAGIGKTMACKQYVSDYPHSSYLVTVNPCLSSINGFLKLLCKALGISASGRKDDMWIKIADELQSLQKVIIIDEAQHLPIKTIEAIRALVDINPELGICMVGNIGTVTNQGKSEFAQIRNRTKLKYIRHTTHITNDDIKLLFAPVENDSKATKLLLNIARSEQGIRGATNVYSNAVDNEDISYSGLLSMAKLMQIHTI